MAASVVAINNTEKRMLPAAAAAAADTEVGPVGLQSTFKMLCFLADRRKRHFKRRRG